MCFEKKEYENLEVSFDFSDREANNNNTIDATELCHINAGTHFTLSVVG